MKTLFDLRNNATRDAFIVNPFSPTCTGGIKTKQLQNFAHCGDAAQNASSLKQPSALHPRGCGHTEALRRAVASCCCVALLGQHWAAFASPQPLQLGQQNSTLHKTQWGDATAQRNSTTLVAASLGRCSQPQSSVAERWEPNSFPPHKKVITDPSTKRLRAGMMGAMEYGQDARCGWGSSHGTDHTLRRCVTEWALDGDWATGVLSPRPFFQVT